MKKIFAIVLGTALMLAGTNAFAQLSVGAGWLNNTERSTDKDNDGKELGTDKANLNGFYAGANYNIAIGKGFIVAPGLYATMQFASGEGSALWGFATGTAKYTELAINVPVNFAYTVEVGDLDVFAYLGPIFQYAVLGKYSTTSDIGGGALTGASERDLYSGDNATRKPFNIYFGGGAGIQAGQFQVILGYDHSLTNLSTVKNNTVSRSQIKIGVGYAF